MVKKMLVGGGAAAILSVGVLVGGLAGGLSGAASVQTQAVHAQTVQPQTPDAPGTERADTGADTQVSMPAGSVSQQQAQDAATSYVKSTAPYSAQNLTFKQVAVDDEDGTAVYKVEFTNANKQSVEVTVNGQGQVTKVDSGNDAAEATGAEGATAEGAKADADGPGGHADAQGAAGSQTGGSQTN